MVNLFLKKGKPNEFNHGTTEIALKQFGCREEGYYCNKEKVAGLRKKKINSLHQALRPLWLYVLERFYFHKCHQSKQEFDVDSGSNGCKENFVLAFTHSCTQHFGLLYKMSLSNSFLFWDFVQREVQSTADFTTYFPDNSQVSLGTRVKSCTSKGKYVTKPKNFTECTVPRTVMLSKFSSATSDG